MQKFARMRMESNSYRMGGKARRDLPQRGEKLLMAKMYTIKDTYCHGHIFQAMKS